MLRCGGVLLSFFLGEAMQYFETERKPRRRPSAHWRALVACSVLIPSLAAAITVSPTSMQLDLKAQRSRTLTVRNPKQQTVPVKVSTAIVTATEHGEEVRESTEDLIAFPSQFMLEPGESRQVRVGSRFTERPDVERFYRVVVEELPVDLSPDPASRSGVKVVLRYVTALYLTPASPASAASLEEVRRAEGGLVFHLRNDGNAHTHLRELVMTLRQGGDSVRLNGSDQLGALQNVNLFARSRREVAWSWPDGEGSRLDPTAPFDVEMNFDCESCPGGSNTLKLSVP